jgi:hypothetical protein
MIDLAGLLQGGSTISGEEKKDVVRRFNEATRRFWQTGEAGRLGGIARARFPAALAGIPPDRQGVLGGASEAPHGISRPREDDRGHAHGGRKGTRPCVGAQHPRRGIPRSADQRQASRALRDARSSGFNSGFKWSDYRAMGRVGPTGLTSAGRDDHVSSSSGAPRRLALVFSRSLGDQPHVGQ